MKNIVICFDGTWNTADAQFPTNVVKTAKMISPADASGADQVVFYDEGLGAGQVAFANSINRLLSGAFGVGLMNNIERAYLFLIFNYAPGDRIFVFGFSRGAFSARSFCGLLRTCGIIDKEHVEKVREAVNLYQNRDREKGADAEPCVKFRREHAFAAYRSPSRAANQIEGKHPLSIEYVGIWDTVGALGVPSHLVFANYFNRGYQFHDLALSSMVRSARHALAIDERRRTFVATPWTNIDKLNLDAAASDASRAAEPYQQQWFPGDHASIGGGGDVNGLWQATLTWVVDGAQACGLHVDHGQLEGYRKDIDHTVSVYSMRNRTFSAASLSSRRWRAGPEAGALSAVSELARKRLREPAERLFERRPYRPKTLRAVLQALLERAGG